MRATPTLRDQVDEAEQTVTVAKDYLRAAEAKLAEARKALLDDVLKASAAPVQAGFARGVQESLSRGGLADPPLPHCAPCQDGAEREAHNMADPRCVDHGVKK